MSRGFRNFLLLLFGICGYITLSDIGFEVFYVAAQQIGAAAVDSQFRYATLRFRNDALAIRRNWRTLQASWDWGYLRNGGVSHDSFVSNIGIVKTFSSTT